eukprot:CAMPEP_0117607116 /NCGR_PEP_ID=MMETSP0784-20121206/80081_1 /TAXON_ID=39447 /ORGANISM="" /LENGTH=249 /DNA_ID=CAMNT_0005410257 /DNA_START=12 /DNA_END=761 /DNA_ORIENTATION=+
MAAIDRGLVGVGAALVTCVAFSSRMLAFTHSGSHGPPPLLRSAVQGTAVGWAPRPQGHIVTIGAEPTVATGRPGSTAALSLAAACLATAFAAASRPRGERLVCRFRKRYGGGAGLKEDPAAIPEYGPQYEPKGGEQRVIPKLSGGSYERRKNMMRNLTTELIRHGRIKTTRARAEALRHFVDRMILLAKRGDDLARREAHEWMFDDKLVDNLFNAARERYPTQTKDFTQVTRTMNRKGDWAEMAYIELV